MAAAERMLAAPLQAAASRSRSSAVQPFAGSTAVTRRLALGQRAGLVDDERVGACRAVSSASAFLIRTPTRARGRSPTMIAIGVARPSAHGQAMISTATALTSACASRGSGPTELQATNVSRRDEHDRRHEIRGDPIGQPLNRRAAALRLADHPHDLREQRVAPTRSARIEQRARAVDHRAADHAIAGLPSRPESARR